MSTCTICEYTTPDGLHICNHCHRRLNELLERVPATLRTAETTLANQGVQPRVGSAGTSAPGAPINLDMSDRLGEYVLRLMQLAHWVNDQEETQRQRVFTDATRAAEYLRAVSNTMRKRDYVADLYTELLNLERRVLSAADRPLVKRPLGECGALQLDEDGAVVKCEGIVEGHETATTGRCKQCHREHDLTDRITDRLTQAMQYRAPLAVVVKALNKAGYPVNYERAKKWAQRGKLFPLCDVRTRQEGHTPAEVLLVMQSMPTVSRQKTNQELISARIVPRMKSISEQTV